MTHTQNSIQERDRLVVLKRELNRHKKSKERIVEPAVGLFMAAQGRLEKKLGSRENRIAFYRWAFNNDKIQSSRDLEVWQKFAIVMWARPAKMGDDWPWAFERQFIVDCNILATNMELAKS